MPRLPKGKVQFNIYIKKEILDELKRLAFQKHGNFRGALSYEAEQALTVWLAMHTQETHKLVDTPMLSNPLNPPLRVQRAWNQIKEFLKKRFGYYAIVPQTQIPRRHLIMAIQYVRGTDKRTIRKWMEYLQRYELIKHLGGEIFEVI